MANENSTYSISGRFTGADKIVAGFLGIKDASDRTTNRIIANNQKAANSWQQHSKSMDAYVSKLHKMDRFIGGYQQISLGGIFRGQIESMKPFIDEALKLSQAQAKFRAINLSETDNQRGFAAVAETVKNLKGMKLNEVTETMTDLHTATGNLSHALEGLQIASKFRFAFQTMMGDKFSPEQVEQSIQKGFKFLEITGVMQQGQKAIEERFNAMVQMMAATGGRVTPDMLLVMAQRGGPATRSLSTAGMRNMAAPLQELSAPRSGTALMSLYSQLVGGRGGGQPSMEEFLRLGLLPKGGVEFSKAGLPKKIKPGAFGAFSRAMQEDPLKAADMLVQAMAKPGKGKAVEGAQLLVEAMRTGATVPAEKLRGVRQELAVLFANRMANSLMDILVTQRAQVVKESTLAETAKNIQQLYDQAIDTPAGKIRQFEAAVANLEALVGGPLLNAVTSVAGPLTSLMQVFAEWPKITLWTLAGIKAIGMLGQLAIAARMSGLTSLFGGGAGAVGVPTAGAAAGSARFAGLATGAVYVAGFAAAAYLITETIEQIMSNKEADKAAGDAGERTAAYFRERFAARLKGASQDVINEIDNAAAAGLAKDIVTQQGLSAAGGSVTGLGPGLGTWGGDPLKPFQSRFVTQLEESAAGRKLGKWAGDEQLEARTHAMGSLYDSGIMNAKQLSEYLKAADKALQEAGRPELYGEITKLATEAFPQLMNQIASQTIPEMDDFSRALVALTGSVDAATGKLKQLGQPLVPLPFPGWKAPGQDKGSFHFGTPDFGGHFKRSSYEPPIGRLPDLMRQVSMGGGEGVTVIVNLSVPGGTADSATIHQIKTAVKHAVRESSVEIRKVLDNRTRDRELMI